jgi:hypothetical protein
MVSHLDYRNVFTTRSDSTQLYHALQWLKVDIDRFFDRVELINPWFD